MNTIENLNQKTSNFTDDTSRNVLVVGATGGTGRATVQKLLEHGHQVTAFSRSADTIKLESDRLVTINGDVTDPVSLDEAVRGQDMVIITLGISENPIRVRFLGASNTPDNVRSTGTRHVITVMQKHGIRRLVVQSSFGVGQTRGKLRFIDRLFFKLILKPQIDDTELQERIIRESNLDWVIAQPVHLTDETTRANPYLSTKGQTRLMQVARHSVARFLMMAAFENDFIGKSVTVSG